MRDFKYYKDKLRETFKKQTGEKAIYWLKDHNCKGLNMGYFDFLERLAAQALADVDKRLKAPPRGEE